MRAQYVIGLLVAGLVLAGCQGTRQTSQTPAPEQPVVTSTGDVDSDIEAIEQEMDRLDTEEDFPTIDETSLGLE